MRVEVLLMGTLASSVSRDSDGALTFRYTLRTADGDKVFATYYGRLHDHDILRDDQKAYTFYIRPVEGAWHQVTLDELEYLQLESLEELFILYLEARRRARAI